MECNLTSCSRRRRGAFTLVEYLFTASIGVVVLAASMVLWGYATRSCASLMAYVDLSNTSKMALDRMSQQIRNARAVQAWSEHELQIALPGASGTNQPTIQYLYDERAQTLRQVFQPVAGRPQTTTLLTECTNFSFVVFQRTPSVGNWDLIESGANTNLTKVVRMEWTCVRPLLGDRNMVEHQVSAKVVIRNQ